MFEAQNFCDGSELNAFDRSISFIDFSSDVSSKLGVKWASSISIAVNMKKMFGIASPLFRKLGAQKLAEIGKLILNIAEDIKLDSMENVLGLIKKRFNSAKELGLDFRKIDASALRNNPLNDTAYTQKVIDQMKLGDFHALPKEVDNFAGIGTKQTIVGGDGITRTKIELPGSYAGKQGRFEWIIDPNGQVNHRLFVPDR